MWFPEPDAIIHRVPYWRETTVAYWRNRRRVRGDAAAERDDNVAWDLLWYGEESPDDADF